MLDDAQKNLPKLYGIKNCDTIKKARKYLEKHHVDFTFHDYRIDGLDTALLDSFIETLGWEALLNTRGTTWRKLDAASREAVNNRATAQTLMLALPAIIKRPLLCSADGSMLLGFSEATYQLFIQERPSLCTVRS